MRTEKGIDLQQVSKANRMKILRLVHEYGSISRTDLAKITKLSLAAVSRITKQLIEEGYLVETGYGDSSGGRKPVNIQPNPKAGYIIGVDFGYSRAKAIIFDFCGGILYEYHAEIRKREYFNGLYEALDSCIGILKERGEDKKLIGIGVGVRGLIDAVNGIILSSTSFQWNNVPLKQILEDRYHIPVFMDINARLAALAEWTLVYQTKVQDLAYITASWGICAGVISNGALCRGVCGAAGEIGASLIYLGNDQTAPLEHLCGGQMLLRKVKENWDSEDCSILKEIVNSESEGPEEVQLEDIIKATEMGDKLCIRLAGEAGRILGYGLVNAAMTLNPQIMILGGMMPDMGEVFLKPVRETVKQLLKPEVLQRLEIRESALGSKASLKGAYLLVFRGNFSETLGAEKDE